MDNLTVVAGNAACLALDEAEVDDRVDPQFASQRSIRQAGRGKHQVLSHTEHALELVSGFTDTHEVVSASSEAVCQNFLCTSILCRRRTVFLSWVPCRQDIGKPHLAADYGKRLRL